MNNQAPSANRQSEPIMVGVDVDSVLAEIAEPLIERLQEQGIGLEFARDKWTSWNFRINNRDIGQEIHAALLDADFVRNLPPIRGSRRGMRYVYERYHVTVVTSRPSETIASTQEWLRRYYRYHAFVNTKRDAKGVLGLSIHIDDDPMATKDFAESGGTAILFSQPWNREEDRELRSRIRQGRIVRCEDWDDVISRFKRWSSTGSLATA